MLPKTFPRPFTGAPRKDRIGGWFGGKPTWRGSSAMTRSRKGLASLIRTPRIPSPTGSGPIACRSTGVIPVVMKSRSRPSEPTTPRAPYRASVSLTASSTIRCRTTSRDRSDARTSRDSSSWSFRSGRGAIPEFFHLFALKWAYRVPQQPGRLSGTPRASDSQTHDMDFFVRYFVELELPIAAVETALDDLPGERLAGLATKAHARALGFMLEADPHAADDFGGAVVLLGMESAAGHGSTRTRPMAWALVG